jgi:hypothetical protein
LPVAWAAFGSDPLLFVSERGDLHIGTTRAHSNFFKKIQGDSYIYGMRTEDKDQLFGADEFYKRLDDRRKGSDKAPIILFVHGCCVSFGEQLLQANDLEKAVDTAYARAPSEAGGRPLTLAYDWIAPFSYATSLEKCYAAQVRFNAFMENFVSRYGSSNVVIVAHSLGTLLVQNYVSQINEQDKGAPFKTIVFSRADIDRDAFVRCLPALRAHSSRLMVLSASNDPNLYASSLLRKLGVKFAQAATLPAKLPLPLPKKKNDSGTSTDSQTGTPDQPPPAPAVPKIKAHERQTRRLGQVKVASEFSSKIEVYDMSALRIGHGIPYKFIGDLLFHNLEDFDLTKDVTDVVIVHSARP